ncbi:MAG TPA: MerR family transcriptional regulator [Gaiellaceae bacterium]|jgi:DNA-binding transcriptional MerR regulator
MPQEPAYKIGEVAQRTGVTTRTIRYYEELGLLGESGREKGRHRLYCDGDISRLRELIRLRNLLGVSLDELKCLLVAEESDLDEALRSIEAQLELVCARHEELQRLEDELAAKRRSIRARLRALRE